MSPMLPALFQPVGFSVGCTATLFSFWPTRTRMEVLTTPHVDAARTFLASRWDRLTRALSFDGRMSTTSAVRLFHQSAVAAYLPEDAAEVREAFAAYLDHPGLTEREHYQRELVALFDRGLEVIRATAKKEEAGESLTPWEQSARIFLHAFPTGYTSLRINSDFIQKCLAPLPYDFHPLWLHTAVTPRGLLSPDELHRALAILVPIAFGSNKAYGLSYAPPEVQALLKENHPSALLVEAVFTKLSARDFKGALADLHRLHAAMLRDKDASLSRLCAGLAGAIEKQYALQVGKRWNGHSTAASFLENAAEHFEEAGDALHRSQALMQAADHRMKEAFISVQFADDRAAEKAMRRAAIDHISADPSHAQQFASEGSKRRFVAFISVQTAGVTPELLYVPSIFPKSPDMKIMRRWFAFAESLARRSPESSCAAEIQARKALFLYQRGLTSEALPVAQKALPIIERLPDQQFWSGMLCYIIAASAEEPLPDIAAQAVAHFRHEDDTLAWQMRCQSLTLLGDLHKRFGNPHLAAPAFEEAGDAWNAIAAGQKQSNDEQALAALAAVHAYQEALHLFAEIDPARSQAIAEKIRRLAPTDAAEKLPSVDGPLGAFPIPTA